MKALSLLMTVAILGITGFQLYWLKQNYEREKKSLELKINSAFHETMWRLQGLKLNLDGIRWSQETEKPSVRITVDGDNDSSGVNLRPRREIISTVNVIRGRLKDSLKKSGGKGVFILNQATVGVHDDSTYFDNQLPHQPGGRDHIFRFLYGVDSLQEKLTVAEIDSAYAIRLTKQGLNIPFTITQLDSTAETGEIIEPLLNRVTVGFAKPVTYELKPGNTFPYLMRQILQPVLFSVLLLGITILSFVLLYRNLLRQRRLAELKNEFISNITHELKTPIATVGVAIEALKNFNAMDNPLRTREYLDISGNELQRLGLLVDKVLKLSMFEKKEIDLKYETVNLHDLVEEVASSLKLQLEKHHAKLSITREGDMNISGDRLHLLSVIFNLLDNALKYGKENPEIKVDIKGNEQNVQMSVSDNGIGIAPEYKDRIFEKFFRIPHGNTHNAKGYGLGLSYAAQVVRKHQGNIFVENNEAGGARFTITLPKTITV